MRKTLMGFVREHRAELDAAIRRAVPEIYAISDIWRRRWVLTNEALHQQARKEGVQI